MDDVQSVAGIVAEALTPTLGQNVPQRVSSGLAEPVRFTTAEDARGFGVPTGEVWGCGGYGAQTAEGMVWRVRVSPGVIGIRRYDVHRAALTAERRADNDRRYADLMGSLQQPEEGSDEFLPLPEKQPGTGEITKWSAKSRMRLSEVVGSLDFSDWTQADGALAMVTLTLPGDWLTVAPDGKTFKKLLKRFENRWRYAMGQDSWRCLWKLEFQRRGAPHWHGLARVPALVGKETFEEWVSRTWCEVVAHPDESERAKHLKAGTGVDFSGKDFSDPRRIALYFLGHSSKTMDDKEYQHIVPEEWQQPGRGPGRFWGHPGIAKAVQEIEVTREDAFAVARVLRKVKRAREWTTAVKREQGKVKRAGQEVPKGFAFTVELPRSKRLGARGRAAHRTMNRNAWAAAQAAGEKWEYQKRFGPSGLGIGGKEAGGWVLVNDALQLGLDIARLFEARAGGEHRNTSYCHQDVGGHASIKPYADSEPSWIEPWAPDLPEGFRLEAPTYDPGSKKLLVTG